MAYNWSQTKKTVEFIKCGKCEEACTQHILIRDELATVQKHLDNKGELLF